MRTAIITGKILQKAKSKKLCAKLVVYDIVHLMYSMTFV